MLVSIVDNWGWSIIHCGYRPMKQRLCMLKIMIYGFWLAGHRKRTCPFSSGGEMNSDEMQIITCQSQNLGLINSRSLERTYIDNSRMGRFTWSGTIYTKIHLKIPPKAGGQAHPYVYKTREAATAACQSIGYRGLCSKSQVKGAGAAPGLQGRVYWCLLMVLRFEEKMGMEGRRHGDVLRSSGVHREVLIHGMHYHPLMFVTWLGWSRCAYGWMADYKGYWFRKTKKGCGRGKGFRKGKKQKKMGAYCCNLAMNSQNLGRSLEYFILKTNLTSQKIVDMVASKQYVFFFWLPHTCDFAAGWIMRLHNRIQ